MKNAIILHGRPSKEQWSNPTFPSTSNYYWLPWAQKELSLTGVPTETPEVPNAWDPDYQVWKTTFEKHTVTPDTLLIGHSCGAGFIVRWLCEHDAIVDKVILVAPWVDIDGDPDNDKTRDFFNFTYDRELVSKTRNGITIIHSINDMSTIQKSVEILMKEIDGIKYIELKNRGHFYDEDCYRLPELLEEVEG